MATKFHHEEEEGTGEEGDEEVEEAREEEEQYSNHSLMENTVLPKAEPTRKYKQNQPTALSLFSLGRNVTETIS